MTLSIWQADLLSRNLRETKDRWLSVVLSREGTSARKFVFNEDLRRL